MQVTTALSLIRFDSSAAHQRGPVINGILYFRISRDSLVHLQWSRQACTLRSSNTSNGNPSFLRCVSEVRNPSPGPQTQALSLRDTQVSQEQSLCCVECISTRLLSPAELHLSNTSLVSLSSSFLLWRLLCKASFSAIPAPSRRISMIYKTSSPPREQPITAADATYHMAVSRCGTSGPRFFSVLYPDKNADRWALLLEIRTADNKVTQSLVPVQKAIEGEFKSPGVDSGTMELLSARGTCLPRLTSNGHCFYAMGLRDTSL